MRFETTYCMNEWVITILLGREWFWVVFICGQSTHPCPFFICQWCRMSCTWGRFGERNMINYKLLHYYYTILPVISYAYWYTYIWNLFCTCKNVYTTILRTYVCIYTTIATSKCRCMLRDFENWDIIHIQLEWVNREGWLEPDMYIHSIRFIFLYQTLRKMPCNWGCLGDQNVDQFTNYCTPRPTILTVLVHIQ